MVVNIQSLVAERELCRSTYKKLLKDISVLEKERSVVLKRIRILTYNIEDGDQSSLFTESTKEKNNETFRL